MEQCNMSTRINKMKKIFIRNKFEKELDLFEKIQLKPTDVDLIYAIQYWY